MKYQEAALLASLLTVGTVAAACGAASSPDKATSTSIQPSVGKGRPTGTPRCELTQAPVSFKDKKYSESTVNALSSILHVSSEALGSNGVVVDVDCTPGVLRSEKHSLVKVEGFYKTCAEIGATSVNRAQGDTDTVHQIAALCLAPSPVISVT